MRIGLQSLAIALIIALIGLPAHACRIRVAFDPHAIQSADLVVIGRVTDYQIVRDPEVRRQRQQTLAANSDISAALRATLEGQTDFISDYALFTVTVDQTLKGEAPRTILAAWDNSTFGEPDVLAPGPYLIAFSNAAAIPSGRYSEARPVLQQPCRSPFILDPLSGNASAVRHILRSPPPSRR